MPRAKNADAPKTGTVNMPTSYWEYVALYLPDAPASAQIREAIDALKRMRPGGPNVFGHAPAKAPRQRKPYKQIQAYADAHGLTRYEAEAELLKQALK